MMEGVVTEGVLHRGEVVIVAIVPDLAPAGVDRGAMFLGIAVERGRGRLHAVRGIVRHAAAGADGAPAIVAMTRGVDHVGP